MHSRGKNFFRVEQLATPHVVAQKLMPLWPRGLDSVWLGVNGSHCLDLELCPQNGEMPDPYNSNLLDEIVRPATPGVTCRARLDADVDGVVVVAVPGPAAGASSLGSRAMAARVVLADNELGVPRSIAQKLTRRITVTRKNRAELRAYVGAVGYPRAVALHGPDGRTVDLMGLSELERAELKLPRRWQVERQLVDGDPVMFNRQPSLHRLSMRHTPLRVLDDTLVS